MAFLGRGGMGVFHKARRLQLIAAWLAIGGFAFTARREQKCATKAVALALADYFLVVQKRPRYHLYLIRYCG
jgi:hypothetical protein